MIALKCPVIVRSIADSLRGLYPETNYRCLVGLICYFLFSKISLSQAARDLPFIPSVSSLARASNSLDPNRFMRRMRKSILRKKNINTEDWVFVLDDTANPKYGDFHRTGYWGCSKGVYKGHKIMVLAIVNIFTHEAIPIDYHIVPKKKKETSPKINFYARYLLRKTLASGFPKLDVIGDSWFDGFAFSSSIENMGLRFVFQLRNNRRVKMNPGPYVPWVLLKDAFTDLKKRRVKTDWDSKRIKSGFKRGKAISEAHLQIKNRKKSLKAIAIYDRRNSAKSFGYYASTDQSMSGTKIWMLSRVRWSIEVIFRCLKQFLGFGKLSCQSKNAVHLSVAMPFYLYYQLSERTPAQLSIPRYLAQIKEGYFNEAIDQIARFPDSKAVQKLRGRRRVDRAHRKPCDTVCGRDRGAA